MINRYRIEFSLNSTYFCLRSLSRKGCQKFMIHNDWYDISHEICRRGCCTLPYYSFDIYIVVIIYEDFKMSNILINEQHLIVKK